ncbi:ATP-dependent helicase/deoxyribonuclease subunit B [bioreactor metagenome]|uniref:ATP-dependent helicase/deoxyribonuclease subunit B n=1 Tax=bioreactor metagenome TaxID=1076179 RepID=A0A645C302_9ZZZZ
MATQATVKQQSQEFRIDPKQLPRQIVQSPSAYTLYQTCPYAYFLTYILDLEQPQSVESDLQPLDRGTLLHRILQALVKAWKVPLYETSPPDVTACKEQIQKVLDEYWLQPELLDLSPKLWQAERNRYRQRFESWLEEELLLFQQRGGVPQQTEWKFGQDSPLILDDACYPIQGKIDRIDSSKEDGKPVYLYDYKTGGSSYYKEYQKKPLLDLQLPCYSLVWEKQQKEPLHSAAYYFPGIGEGKPELVETVHPENWADLKEGTLRLLRNIDTLISKGIFPRAPQKEDTCGYCEYASLCRKE